MNETINKIRAHAMLLGEAIKPGREIPKPWTYGGTEGGDHVFTDATGARWYVDLVLDEVRDESESARADAFQFYSDLHKDRHGFRPRGQYLATWTVQDFHDAIDALPEFEPQESGPAPTSGPGWKLTPG